MITTDRSVSLDINGMSKRFSGDASIVLDNISLSIAEGEFVCLLGASGCGKTTLLNLIAGLDVPTSGTISTNARTSLIFQEPALFPWLTAGKNIELALKAAGVERARRKE